MINRTFAVSSASMATSAGTRLAFHLPGTSTHTCQSVPGYFTLSTDPGLDPGSLDYRPDALNDSAITPPAEIFT